MMPKEDDPDDPEDYLTSIDAVEKTTGLGFFPDPEDGVEAELEAEEAMNL